MTTTGRERTGSRDAPHAGERPVAGTAPVAFILRAAVPGLPAVTALALGCWQLSARSFTQDEAATLSAVKRPLPALMRMLGHIDAVHGVYYALIHLVAVTAGASEADVRFPSVAASAMAAALLATLGARLAGRRAGLAAGLLYAASPPVTEYAQMARPYALATALTVLAVDRFAVFAATGTRRNATAYAVALTVAGWVNLLTLLAGLAALVTTALAPGWRPRLPRLVAASAATGVAVGPLIWLGVAQIGQIGWEQPPTVSDLLILAGVLVLAAGLTATALAAPVPIAGARRPGGKQPGGQPGRKLGGPATLAAVAAPWLMLPPVILAAASQITPMWEPRYLLFCLPAGVLLAVAATARLPPRAAAAAAAVTVAGLLAAQPLVRPAVAADDLRAVSRMLAAKARAGDAVVFPDVGRRLIKDAYPAGFAHLRDVGLDTSPAARDSLYGLNVGGPVLQRRLAGVSKLWVIRYSTPHPGPYYGTALAPREFCASHTWQFPGSTVTLYHRCPQAGLPAHARLRPRRSP